MVRAVLTRDKETMETQGDYILIIAFTSTDERTSGQIYAGGEISFPEFMATFGEAAARKIVDAGKKMGLPDRGIIRTAERFSEQIIEEVVKEIIERRSHD